MKKLFAKIKKENLRPEEKEAVLSALKSFVAKNPVQEIESPFYHNWFVFQYRTVSVFAAAIFFVFTGTVLAAKNSVPGDILYPIKMLREDVESFVAPDAKAKAEVEVSHAITRLQEIEQIVNLKKPLEKGSGEEISENFGNQVRGVSDNIKKLRDSGQEEEAVKIQSEFKKSLEEHENSIRKVITETEAGTEIETKEELSRIYSDLREHLEKAREDEKEREDSDKQEQEEGEVKGIETEKQKPEENKKDSEDRKEDKKDSEEEDRD